MRDLKQRAMRGGLAKIVVHISTLLLRTGMLMILARLLTPADFGLVGMVTAMIGVFSWFRDFGLSAAAVQRHSITPEQSSTLFWINLLVGAVLSLTAAAMGPLASRFYHQPQLIGITAVLATAFFFNSAGVQHGALLERQMRFVTLSLIDIVSLVISTSVTILMALRGLGHWALVANSTITPFVYSIGVWLAARWVPGRPRRGQGILSMMRFGGTLTANGLVMYFAMNIDKILLGRFWGVEALGIYGRAYQLVNTPADSLNNAAGGVIFAALCRVQGEAERLRSYFLKAYSLVLSLTVPVTLMCGLFGDDIINILLGSKWSSAIVVFRCLAPTTLAFAILVPINWLLASRGLVNRGLKMALTLASILIAGNAIGVHWGPKGVAIAYSTVMMVTVIPLAAWAVHGTPISLRQLLQAIGRPVLSGIVAAVPTFLLRMFIGSALSPIPRLALSVAIVCAIYLVILLYVMGQKNLYVEIFRGFVSPPRADGTVAASA
jgi:O-antigen/teichoic acid export membrane protein